MTTTLKLPSSYEELSQEEMMYLDGGYWLDVSRSAAANIIDGAIVLATAGISLHAQMGLLVRKLGRNKAKAVISQTITRLGLFGGIVHTITATAVDLLGLSIGGAVAYALDRFDRSGLNGRVQF